MINKILCFVFNHQLTTIRPLLIGGELVECRRCKAKLCIHHGRRQVIPYDKEVEHFEDLLRRLNAKYQDTTDQAQLAAVGVPEDILSTLQPGRELDLWLHWAVKHSLPWQDTQAIVNEAFPK